MFEYNWYILGITFNDDYNINRIVLSVFCN